jgi:hypothetical protein
VLAWNFSLPESTTVAFFSLRLMIPRPENLSPYRLGISRRPGSEKKARPCSPSQRTTR